ncbi:Vascular endothelial growth factor A-A [Trachymyrmex septentrionalis]|uniref:Vascular endothelial growth factor A-A n=1 Tax=Trachymyrmex septentrionalis TaxID=34720 RepID=A0A151JWF5_9HYME|nr:Vascular endothelial growth factor A-A [Trachymyrmex septentrionalis]
MTSIFTVLLGFLHPKPGDIKRKENRKKNSEGNEARKRKVTRSTLSNYGHFEEFLGTVRLIPPQIFFSYRESVGRSLCEEKLKSKWQRERRNRRRQDEVREKLDNSYVYFALIAVGRHHRDSDFLSHVQLVHQFQCLLPQSRAIAVEDLLTVGLGPDEAFYPASTVLTRCVGSGCCPDSKQICAPIETRNVTLVFMVRHRIDQQRDRHHEVIHAVEHTKCACMDKILAMKKSRF